MNFFSTSNPLDRDKQIIRIVSIVIFCALVLLYVTRALFFHVPPDTDTLVTMTVFAFPVISGLLGWIRVSSILLSWSPILVIYYLFISRFLIIKATPIDLYEASKIYLLGFSVIPFLLLDSKQTRIFLLGISVSVVGALFSDPIFDYFGVGPASMGANEESVRFNTLRFIVAYFVLCGSAFSLRYIVDRTDRLNRRLISELEHKNRIIKDQAESDVAILNTQLQENFNKQVKVNRELALLNSVNDMLSEVSSVPKLFEALCRIIVVEGGYQLVWIGRMPSLTDGDNKIKPIESYGPAIDYLKDLVIDLNNPNHRAGPTAQILMKGETRVTNQPMNDPNFESWRSLAAKHGFQSSMGVCIKAEPVDRFALNVYSANPNAFDHNEISILERVALNVATAIKAIHAAHERDLTKRELQRAFERINYHVSNTPLAVIERDKDLKITYWNKRAEELFGWKREEVIGKKSSDLLVHPDEKEDTERMMNEMNEWRINSSFLERRNIRKNGEILYCKWYYSMLRDDQGDIKTVLSFVSDLTEQRRATHQLKERIKELTTMYRVSLILSEADQDLDKVAQSIVQVLPSGWQHNEICEARIQLFGKQYATANFKNSEYKQRAEIVVDNEPIGFIEVVYLVETPLENEGPFLLEERSLIHVLVEMLQIYLQRIKEEAELNKAQANLRATINNTEILIWSVDRNFNLLTFNEPFERYIKEHHNVQIKLGSRVLGENRLLSDSIISKSWETRYLQVLAGENISLEETRFNIDLKFSLNPIIEKGEIIGVSVYADNMTERNKRDRELAEANRKISELKVMALRSVMNPHFVFNVLNSIQFFIAKNDRQNAISYLSTFSKLIRTVLTHSVAERIPLTEEINMLKNYIDLEKVRFEDKFTYRFEIDESVELETISIPSLLIQPYIENAILHGLDNKEGEGKLTIRVKTVDDYLLFQIEDNGIGREAAAIIKANKQALHESMGTKLTEERLRVINQNSEHHVVFEDLRDGKNVLGTRVTIKIKI